MLGFPGSGVLDDDVDGLEEHRVRRRADLADPVVELSLRHLEALCKLRVAPNHGRCALKRKRVIR